MVKIADPLDLRKDPPLEWLLKIPARFGNAVVGLLREENQLHPKYKILKEGHNLLIPLLNRPLDLPHFEEHYGALLITPADIVTGTPLKEKSGPMNLLEFLKTKVPPDIFPLIPRSFDVLGSIAILELNREEQNTLQPYKDLIAQSILNIQPNIKSVFEKAGDVSGTYRTRKLQLLAGVPTTQTVYKENECRFYLDVEKTFFTPRLVFERNRIAHYNSAQFDSRGVIWDMFCGVGPFFMQIAKVNPGVQIFATDINPHAIELARKNIQLNKITSNIECIQADIRSFHAENADYPHEKFHKRVSRIIMNLPEQSLDFLQYLPRFLHPEGTLIHIYQFNEKPNAIPDAIEKLTTKLALSNLTLVKILSSRIVKPYSPALDTTVLDVIIS
ncbi:MAG: methyltransferase domain-containing protein [Candidatus Heimdallarchaeota archaeon]|nr:methyltransferase domain-containing protein [Candidatus Heimdallarchaeota archaeon]